MSTYMVNYPAKNMRVEVTTDEFEAYINRLANTKKCAVDFDGLNSFFGGLETGSGRFILPDDSVEEFTVEQVYDGGFVITEDLITKADEDTYAVGRIGPMPLAPSLIKELKKGEKCKGYQFVLKDDDGQTHYEGRAYDPTGEYDESWVYMIWRWGVAMSGTTLLHFPYKSNLDIG